MWIATLTNVWNVVYYAEDADLQVVIDKVIKHANILDAELGEELEAWKEAGNTDINSLKLLIESYNPAYLLSIGEIDEL